MDGIRAQLDAGGKEPDPRASRGRRVLVVDDNRDIALSTSWLLELEGHQVQTSFDGLDALKVASRFLPEAALIDVGLPGLNGHEVAARLREQFGEDLLLVLITAYNSNDRRDDSKPAFDHYFVKPLDFAVITELLHW
ncbi:response regulator [Aquisphaera insulae]|uniref:response regulator n=1 Tax=Aquisphaera insulae TaxID=2712864 RepID=UPI0013EABD86|nr:response regulator [Aquisphaera insulae]